MSHTGGPKLEMTEHDNLVQNTSSSEHHHHRHHSSPAHVDDHQSPTDDEVAEYGEEVAAELHIDISKIVAPDGVTIGGCYVSQNVVVFIGTIFTIIASISMGVGLVPPKDNPAWKTASSVIGWTYFWIWALSFFPQITLNHIRKSVVGQNADYLMLNFWGFTAYTIFNCCFYFSPGIQKEYQDRFNSKEQVQLNDVAFAVGALLLTIYNVLQYYAFGYERAAQVVSKPIRIFIIVTIAGTSIWGILIAAGVRTKYFFVPLDLLYGLGIVKLAITVIKYPPQIIMNYRRKTTVGWSILNVLQDFSGGLLSVLQEVMDAGFSGKWEAMIGNPVKFGLGFSSVVYDIIMLVQHFCIYADRNRELIEEHHRTVREAAEAAAAAAAAAAPSALADGDIPSRGQKDQERQQYDSTT